VNWLRRQSMWFDAIACLVFPKLARWGVAVVDRFDGERYPVPSLRLRWRASLDEWTRIATTGLIQRDDGVQFEARRLEP
jgi:hypothetical protein